MTLFLLAESWKCTSVEIILKPIKIFLPEWPQENKLPSRQYLALGTLPYWTSPGICSWTANPVLTGPWLYLLSLKQITNSIFKFHSTLHLPLARRLLAIGGSSKPTQDTTRGLLPKLYYWKWIWHRLSYIAKSNKYCHSPRRLLLTRPGERKTYRQEQHLARVGLAVLFSAYFLKNSPKTEFPFSENPWLTV